MVRSAHTKDPTSVVLSIVPTDEDTQVQATEEAPMPGDLTDQAGPELETAESPLPDGLVEAALEDLEQPRPAPPSRPPVAALAETVPAPLVPPEVVPPPPVVVEAPAPAGGRTGILAVLLSMGFLGGGAMAFGAALLVLLAVLAGGGLYVYSTIPSVDPATGASGAETVTPDSDASVGGSSEGLPDPVIVPAPGEAAESTAAAPDKAAAAEPEKAPAKPEATVPTPATPAPTTAPAPPSAAPAATPVPPEAPAGTPDAAPEAPPAAPAAGPRTISIKFISDPPAARLFIDGQDRGRTPTKLDLPLGTYSVTLEAGKLTGELSIDVGDGQEKYCFAPTGKKLNETSCN